MTSTSGGEAIVNGLVAHGVDTVFGLPGAQIYGLFENLFDKNYSVYGTYFSVDDANDLSDVTGVTFNENNPRTVVPAIPFAAYGGVKVKF